MEAKEQHHDRHRVIGQSQLGDCRRPPTVIRSIERTPNHFGEILTYPVSPSQKSLGASSETSLGPTSPFISPRVTAGRHPLRAAVW
jgi:hypothetical protein